jgi:addiction module antitoxin, relB/dinJ family
MAASRMIQAKVPGDIPDRANEIIEAPGLTVSDATRIAQDRRIPPELFQPNAETLAAFAEIDRGGLKRFDSVDELMANLNAED